MNEIVVDATGVTLGRLASFAAKKALLGNKVTIVNCQESVITGRIGATVETYKAKVGRGGASQQGPNFPRQAERIVKRTVRGMLPHRQERGRKALDNVICYSGVPAEYADKKKNLQSREKTVSFISLNKLTKEL